MDVTQIPFVKHIGIEKPDKETLKLKATDKLQNHMQTIHAAAQFALAETQSGLALQKSFPELEGKVVALLRSSSVKFKSLATTTLNAHAHVNTDIKERFLTQFEKKGRAGITVMVELTDVEGMVVMMGSFSWFVQQK